MATTNKKHLGRKTTVALKAIMAISGLFFVFFLLMHMYGNLKMFLGADAYNGYATFLREVGYPLVPHEGVLWILRILLIVAIVAHVYSALKLWNRASTARGSAYKVNSGKKVGPKYAYSARVMRWGGIILALFIIFHLLQYTILKINIGADYASITPYERMVAGFGPDVWYMWIFYFIAVAALAFHVRHGVWSALATLGLSNRNRERGFKLAGDIVAFILIVGFMAAPTAILFGWIS